MVSGPRRESVTTSAVALVSYSAKRTSLTLVNVGSADIYWGLKPGVTTGTGFPIASGQSNTFNFRNGEDPRLKRWFIASSTQAIAITEGYGVRPDVDIMEEGGI